MNRTDDCFFPLKNVGKVIAGVIAFFVILVVCVFIFGCHCTDDADLGMTTEPPPAFTNVKEENSYDSAPRRGTPIVPQLKPR